MGAVSTIRHSVARQSRFGLEGGGKGILKSWGTVTFDAFCLFLGG